MSAKLLSLAAAVMVLAVSAAKPQPSGVVPPTGAAPRGAVPRGPVPHDTASKPKVSLTASKGHVDKKWWPFSSSVASLTSDAKKVEPLIPLSQWPFSSASGATPAMKETAATAVKETAATAVKETAATAVKESAVTLVKQTAVAVEVSAAQKAADAQKRMQAVVHLHDLKVAEEAKAAGASAILVTAEAEAKAAHDKAAAVVKAAAAKAAEALATHAKAEAEAKVAKDKADAAQAAHVKALEVKVAKEQQQAKEQKEAAVLEAEAKVGREMMAAAAKAKAKAAAKEAAARAEADKVVAEKLAAKAKEAHEAAAEEAKKAKAEHDKVEAEVQEQRVAFAKLHAEAEEQRVAKAKAVEAKAKAAEAKAKAEAEKEAAEKKAAAAQEAKVLEEQEEAETQKARAALEKLKKVALNEKHKAEAAKTEKIKRAKVAAAAKEWQQEEAARVEAAKVEAETAKANAAEESGDYSQIAHHAASKMEQAIQAAEGDSNVVEVVKHTVQSAASPSAKVVQLLKEMESRANSDNDANQKTYDTYACWCEDKLGKTALDIKSEKKVIEDMQTLINKLSGELGAHNAKVKIGKKAVADNAADIKDMEQMRGSENAEFVDQKSGLEASISALEAAIEMLAGAGTKKGFLDTSNHETALLSVVGEIRPLIKQTMPSSIPDSDVELLKRFVSKPSDFFGGQVSAMQTGQNPMGDFAPQSTQIGGVLKGMYDAFVADMEKANVQEAESQKSFESLKETKESEGNTLRSELGKQEGFSADKTVDMEEAKTQRSENQDMLEADEAFFEKTTDACKTKATEWSRQMRLRTQELVGLGEAIKILEDGAAVLGRSLPDQSSAASLLQVTSVDTAFNSLDRNRMAYTKLQKIATKYKSMQLARVAVSVLGDVDFSKVFASIDAMIANLRAEEQDDIKQRDVCQRSQNANTNKLADIQAALSKTGASVGRMNTKKDDLDTVIKDLGTAIGATEGSIKELDGFNKDDNDNYQKERKDDQEALGLLKAANAALLKFSGSRSEEKRIEQEVRGSSFIQIWASGPDDSADAAAAANVAVAPKDAPAEVADAPKEVAKRASQEDNAPEAISGGEYDGRASETRGVTSILSMLEEDIEKELTEGASDMQDTNDKFAKQRAGLEETLKAQAATKATTEGQRADLQEKISKLEKMKERKTDEKGQGSTLKEELRKECSWATGQFETRRTKRKTEMDGLVDAKEFLSGGLGGSMVPTDSEMTKSD